MQGKGAPLPLQPIPKSNHNTKTKTKTKNNNKIKVVYTENLTDPFLRVGTIRILLQSRSATASTTPQPSCDGSMWNPKPSFAEWRVNNLTMASASRWRAERGPGTSRGRCDRRGATPPGRRSITRSCTSNQKLEAIRSPSARLLVLCLRDGP